MNLPKVAKKVFIDYEYFNSNEEYVSPICCSLQSAIGETLGELEEFWLLSLSDQKTCELRNTLAARVKFFQENGYIFICYAATAEGRATHALGIKNLFDYLVVDLHIEYKALLNHSPFAYGAQLMSGAVKFTEPKLSKYELERGEEQTYSAEKAQTNLAAACFKLLGKKIDTDHKDYVRNICIEGSAGRIISNQKLIQDYCSSDIVLLPQLFSKIYESNKVVVNSCGHLSEYDRSIFDRGRLAFSSCTYMQSTGIPLNYDGLLNLASNAEDILGQTFLKASQTVLKSEGFTPFYYAAKERKWKVREKSIQSWIASNPLYKNRWPLAEKGSYSLKQETVAEMCADKHVFAESLISQYKRVLEIQQTLRSMRPSPGKRSFFDSVGTDKISRPYLNPAGTQSFRFAPPATTFLFAKSAWLRSLCDVPAGDIMLTFDYSQQEFLLNAVLSGDKNMMKAYEDGDVYLYTAKLAGVVPMDATKKTHPNERQLFKAVVLGISFSMSSVGLTYKLISDTLSPEDRSIFGAGCMFNSYDDMVMEMTEKAEELLELFWEAYPAYKDYVDEQWPAYQDQDGLVVPKILYPMHGINKNKRSVGNCRTQGSGAAILETLLDKLTRYGVAKYGKGIVTNGLHDAAYMKLPYKDSVSFGEDVKNIHTLFGEAYREWVSWLGFNPDTVPPIRVGGEAWGSWINPNTFEGKEWEEVAPGLFEGEFVVANLKIAIATLHRDERISVRDFLGYSKHLQPATSWE